MHTTRYSRGRLPHWEIEGARYFVTVRCHGSLPADVMAQLREVHVALQAIQPASKEFALLQRKYFLTMEKYLDQGAGAVPFCRPTAAIILQRELETLIEEGALVPHYSIMPNHWHALLAPKPGTTLDLHAIMARLKGRTARDINSALSRSGPFWQREWFDRWVRNEAEWEKCRDYIRQNPVKAGLAKDWRDHPWTR